MQYRIREVTDRADPMIDRIWTMCQRAHRAELACGPGATWPKRGHLDNAVTSPGRRLYVAVDDRGRPVGMMIARAADGRIDWFKGEPHLVGELLGALGTRVHDDLGDAWGVIPNPAVRTAPAGHPHGIDEGEDTAILRWRD